jgi:hypothetical protein
MNIQTTPSGYFRCWYVEEDEVLRAKVTGAPFAENKPTDDYFQLTNRIDEIFIQGHIARKNKDFSRLTDILEQYTYLINYIERKKVYFTFDHITLFELQELYTSYPNPIVFTLKRIDIFKSTKTNQAFMIMPFHQELLDNLYITHIKPLLKKEFGIEIFRADDFRDNDIIIETIYRLIKESELIIADTTIPNKNAFYELGYASCLGKEIITIQNKKEQKLFFDRAHIRSIFYDVDPEPFLFELKSTIQAISSRT